jgi:hypothetical protein
MWFLEIFFFNNFMSLLLKKNESFFDEKTRFI